MNENHNSNMIEPNQVRRFNLEKMPYLFSGYNSNKNAIKYTSFSEFLSFCFIIIIYKS